MKFILGLVENSLKSFKQMNEKLKISAPKGKQREYMTQSPGLTWAITHQTQACPECHRPGLYPSIFLMGNGPVRGNSDHLWLELSHWIVKPLWLGRMECSKPPLEKFYCYMFYQQENSSLLFSTPHSPLYLSEMVRSLAQPRNGLKAYSKC